MANIVLIHGAWHWGGCWRLVADILVGQGHRVHAPSLPMTAADSLETQIEAAYEVVVAIPGDVVVVGHSFGGFIAAGLLGKCADKIPHAVFLDAWLPEKGKDFFDVAMPSWGRVFLRFMAKIRPLLPPLHSPATLGVTDPSQASWLAENLVGQPTATLTALFPYELSDYSGTCTYIHCLQGLKSNMPAHFADMPRRARLMGWRVAEIESGHDAMIAAPHEVAALIHDAAQSAFVTDTPPIAPAA